MRRVRIVGWELFEHIVDVIVGSNVHVIGRHLSRLRWMRDCRAGG